MSSSESHYEVLGIPLDATSDDIHAAWRRQMMLWHPDRNEGAAAAARARVLNEARNTLLDPVKRRAYDRTLKLMLSLEADRARPEGVASGILPMLGRRPAWPGHSKGGSKWAYAHSGYAARRMLAAATSKGAGGQAGSVGEPSPLGLEGVIRRGGAWLVLPFSRYPRSGITSFAVQALVRVALLGAASWLLWVIVPIVIRGLVVLTLAVASILSLVALAGFVGTGLSQRFRKSRRRST